MRDFRLFIFFFFASKINLAWLTKMFSLHLRKLDKYIINEEVEIFISPKWHQLLGFFLSLSYIDTERILKSPSVNLQRVKIERKKIRCIDREKKLRYTSLLSPPAGPETLLSTRSYTLHSKLASFTAEKKLTHEQMQTILR